MDGSLSLGDIERHFWLTRSIARVLNVNLSEAMAHGHLTETGYAEMVTNCRAAGCQHACEHWLATETGCPETAPEHCANAAILNRLRKLQNG